MVKSSLYKEFHLRRIKRSLHLFVHDGWCHGPTDNGQEISEIEKLHMRCAIIYSTLTKWDNVLLNERLIRMKYSLNISLLFLWKIMNYQGLVKFSYFSMEYDRWLRGGEIRFSKSRTRDTINQNWQLRVQKPILCSQ